MVQKEQEGLLRTLDGFGQGAKAFIRNRSAGLAGRRGIQKGESDLVFFNAVKRPADSRLLRTEFPVNAQQDFPVIVIARRDIKRTLQTLQFPEGAPVRVCGAVGGDITRYGNKIDRKRPAQDIVGQPGKRKRRVGAAESKGAALTEMQIGKKSRKR